MNPHERLIDQEIDEDDKEIVEAIFKKFNYSSDEFYSFWNRNEVQLDGIFDLKELRTWVKVMEALKKERGKQ